MRTITKQFKAVHIKPYRKEISPLPISMLAADATIVYGDTSEIRTQHLKICQPHTPLPKGGKI